MAPEHIDGKAVAFGGLGGAVTFAVPLLLAGARVADPYTMLVATFGAGILAGGVSGAIAGYTSSTGLKPIYEGSMAATIGFCLGLSIWVGGHVYQSPLHPADTALILLYVLALPATMAFPFVILTGALLAERALFAK